MAEHRKKRFQTRNEVNVNGDHHQTELNYDMRRREMLNHEMSYLTAYRERLLKNCEAAQKKKAEKEKPLRERIAEWHNNQSLADRQRTYTMNELVQQFRRPPSVIGPVLHDLGWQRTRVWGKGGPYRRSWKVPA